MNMFKSMNTFLLFLLCCIPFQGCDETNPTPNPQPEARIEISPSDSRWELASSYVNNPQFPWISEHKCYASYGEGRGKSFFTAVSQDGSGLEFCVAENGPAIRKLKKDDCLLFCIPMASLAAGTDVDFMITLSPASEKTPCDWVFEYQDGEEWKKSGEAFRLVYGESNHSSIVRSFTTSTPIEQDTLKLRCRVESGKYCSGTDIPSDGSEGCVYLAPVNFQSCRVLTYPAGRFPQASDSKRVLALGNSFSYYCAPVWMFKEIARSEGHAIELRMNVKPSQTFSNHLSLTLSKEEIEKGLYDYALIQDQSTQHSKYFKNPEANTQILEGTVKLRNRIAGHSPECTVILENTWAYDNSDFMGFGSFAAFDEALTQGAAMIAKAAHCAVSPIGPAFAAAREQGVGLYHADEKHQGEYGAYLKACVNYLTVYGKPFSGSVSDCNLPAETAAVLRSIAENTVLSK